VQDCFGHLLELQLAHQQEQQEQQLQLLLSGIVHQALTD
jgi:hypothetical protein